MCFNIKTGIIHLKSRDVSKNISHFHPISTSEAHMKSRGVSEVKALTTFKLTFRCNHSIFIIKCMRGRRATFKAQNKKKKSTCGFGGLFFFSLPLTLERVCHKATAGKLELSQSSSTSEATSYFKKLSFP